MNDAESTGLDADILSLLEAERSPELAPAESKERVWERVQETLALPPVASGPPETAVLTGSGAATVVGYVVVVGIIAAAVVSQTQPQIASYNPPPEASVQKLMEPRPQAASTLPPMVPVVVTPPERLEEAATAPVAQSAPAPTSGVRAPGRARRAPSTTSSAEAERSLLDQGRRALREGRANAALSVADEHRARFPRGRLVEEREALRIRALDRLGRRDASRAAARDFMKRYPSSIHGLAVERILGSD